MLKIIKPYYIYPDSMAFALLGTRHHSKLEAIAGKLSMVSELLLEDDETRGTFDLLEPDTTGSYVLSDYKTSGSYKVASALGIQSRKVVDPSGEAYKRDVVDKARLEVTGVTEYFHRKGDPKLISEFYIDESAKDLREWELQLNNYRLKVEACGFPISRLQVQATVRDGGTQAAKSRGVDKNIYMIPIKILPDDDVNAYFTRKSRVLLAAIETGAAPVCNNEERWNDRRCASYCEVKEFCDHGRSLK